VLDLAAADLLRRREAAGASREPVARPCRRGRLRTHVVGKGVRQISILIKQE
jgi:hypothetical protein